MQDKIWTRRVQGVVIASLLGMMLGGSAHGDCKPQNAGGISNSGTITGAGADSVGSQAAIGQDTTGEHRAVCLPPAWIQVSRRGEAYSTASPELRPKPALR